MFNSVLILFSAYRGDVPNRDKEVAAGIQRFFYFKRHDIISAMPKLLALILLFPLLFSCQSVGTGMGSIEIEPTLNEVQPSTIESVEEEFAESIKVVEEPHAETGEEEVISTRELVERINNISSGNKAPSLTEEEVVIETEPRDLAGEVPVEGVVLNEIPRELPETAPGNASEMRWMDQRLDDLSYMLLFMWMDTRKISPRSIFHALLFLHRHQQNAHEVHRVRAPLHRLRLQLRGNGETEVRICTHRGKSR